MALIELEKITRSYFLDGEELQVLRDVTLKIEEGEFVAIMGPSGSGKSTLMQILGLLDRPTGGLYRLMGKDVSRLSDDEGAAFRRETIGFIFQMFNLLPRTSALQNVALPMVYAGTPDRDARARELLVQVGLADRLEHKPNQLSGGQQQRVAIARSLANHPRVIFADEPTGNLASDQAEEILSQLVHMNRSGITVIMVTHESDIAAHAKRIIRIKDGRVIADDPSPGKAPGGAAGTSSPRTKPPLPIKIKAEPRSDLGTLWAEFKEYALSAMRGMTANKVRSGLSMLGILIGVAAVITMLALGKGAQKAIESRLASLGSNLLAMRPGSPSQHGVHGGDYSRFTLDDLKAIAKANPHILRVDGNVQGNVQVVYGNQNANTQVTGVTPAYERMRASTPYAGRFFTPTENLNRERVVLLGQTVVSKLFGDEDPIGKFIKVNRINFKVIGVLPIKGGGGFRDEDDILLIPLNTAMNRLLGQKYLRNISIECDGPDSMEAVTEDITRIMRRRHRLPSYKENDFEIRNMADIQAAISSTTKTITLLLGFVAAISLLVGGIGIMNIMLVSVSERTREIGLRKAVGAARRAILWQFLIESGVMSAVGGLTGILLGALTSFTLSKLAGWTAVVTVQSVMVSFVFSAGVGVLFGLWPARKASLLSPIEALRYE
ncbi:MAG TPA: ABC transporter permease [Elusimicrobiota bacterium]|nr:ABC transporter permease [Elusimicrobiota bacterium]